jgi:uncharacterized protein (TIGR02266 family)
VPAPHFRLRPRYPLRVRVSVRRQHEKSLREVDAQTENLSFGGAFVLIDPPLAPETRVLVSIASAITWDPLRLPGTVRWVRDSRPGVAAGMGIAFDQLGPESAVALQALFESLGFDEE